MGLLQAAAIKLSGGWAGAHQRVELWKVFRSINAKNMFRVVPHSLSLNKVYVLFVDDEIRHWIKKIFLRDGSTKRPYRRMKIRSNLCRL